MVLTNKLEAILTRFSKQFLSFLLIALLLAPAAFAKEDSHELLAKTFQQSDIWTHGPLKLTAQVELPKQGGGEVTVTYTVSWDSPEKWRAEWSANGLEQVTVLNNGKLSFFTNQTAPLLWARLFESAIAASDLGNPAGPFTVPPLDWDKAKLDTSKKKVGSVEEKCMAFDQPAETLCVDPGTARLMSFDVGFTSFEYSDYVASGDASYPQTIKVSFNKQPIVSGKLTVTRGEKFADSLFTAPEKSTTIDFPSCADVDKNYTAPHLTKPIAPKMPEEARKKKEYGVVWVLANVGTDGSVQKATIIAGNPDLNPAATEAVNQYKFTPYIRCGKPAEFQKVLVVPFAPVQQPADERGNLGH